ncbi:MAG TPA: anhydro-N-acetylmuramic acid kinase [Xanthobacteraceae bacterium]|nr:anhydro-N-acetylmuramic acid kinase [Xanthobacteraceae bacterium]
MKALGAIGLMSGTSLDGVDVALLRTDGERIEHFGPTGYRPYGESERALLRRALRESEALIDRTIRPGVLAEAEALVTRAHAEAVERLLADYRLSPQDIDVVGFPGQTVIHRPEQHLTVQIGDGRALARRLGIAVVYDFRAADIAAGGQGAPLTPVFHCALVKTIHRPPPVAVLNIGGVANLTYVDRDLDPLACDTGPGNALIDDFMRARTGAPYDLDGAAAARGKPDHAFIARFLTHPFFDRKPPKSLDRNAFAFPDPGLPQFSVPDGAATLSALTVEAVLRVLPHLPKTPHAWIVSGGGARNLTLMRLLAQRLAPATVETADQVGWSAAALEAQAFAYLAVRCLRNLPITFPTTSGAPRPLSGGVVVRP